MTNEITTVECKGVDGSLGATQATVEAGPTPRRVSCPFAVAEVVEVYEGKKRVVLCKPVYDGYDQTKRGLPFEKLVRCTHAYPAE